MANLEPDNLVLINKRLVAILLVFEYGTGEGGHSRRFIMLNGTSKVSNQD